MRQFLFCALSLCLAACGGGSSTGAAGICVHQYLDPVLHFEGAVDAETEVPISSIVISNVSLNGAAVSEDQLRVNASNAAVSGSMITCTLPCGLLQSEGPYALTVSASGYAPQSIGVVAKYRTFAGGCPSSSSDGTVIQLRLQRP